MPYDGADAPARAGIIACEVALASRRRALLQPRERAAAQLLSPDSTGPNRSQLLPLNFMSCISLIGA